MEKNFQIRDLRKKEKFVVDDLYLNGYAKKFGVYATAVYLSLCRHADREQKSFPSVKKIAEEHNVSERQVFRAIKILEKYNLVRKERIGKKANNRYYLIDKSEWTTSHITPDYQSHHPLTTSPVHSKETHKKETHSKDSNASVATKEPDLINPLIDKFKIINPSYKRLFANKTQRSAIERLIKEHGVDKVSAMIDFLPQIRDKRYAPVITTPLELENKLAQLINYQLKEIKNPLIGIVK